MPVVVRDYEWSETDTTLVVSIPLKGVPAKKVDIYGSVHKSGVSVLFL